LSPGAGAFSYGKPTHRPHPCHAASRAIALDMREALGGELLDGGMRSGSWPQILDRIGALDRRSLKKA
jgi:hypothetical protein